MKKLIVGLVIGLMVGTIVGSALSAKPAAVQSTATQPKPPTIAQLLTLVNAERAKYGVAPLKEDARLDASAQLKANDEVAYNYFGHVSPVTGTKNGLQAIDATGIPCVYESENLHFATLNILSAQETVDGWIASPPHHAAMIDPKYSLTGFGIDGTQVVEHFCQQ